MIKYKTKPIQKAEMREQVERKFRARGAVLFHTMIFLLASGLFLGYLPTAWALQFENRYDNAFADAVLLYGILATSFALNFFRYHYKYGAGYTKHQAETDALTNRRLSQSDPAEWEDQEELIGIQQNSKLKNCRLLFQHLALYLGINSMVILVQWSNILRFSWYDDEAWRVPFYLAGAWGIGLLAHALRYFFAWGHSAERGQAKIDAEVARELADLARSSRRSAGSISDGQTRDQHSVGRDISLDLLLSDEPKQASKASSD